MRNFYEKNKQSLVDLTLLIGAIIFCFLFFRYLFVIFLPFLAGWLLSLLFSPLADKLQKYRIPRGIGALLGIFLLLALLGLLGFWFGTGIQQKLTDFSENLPNYMKALEQQLTAFWAQFDALREQMPMQLQEGFLHLQQDFSNILLSIVRKSGSSSLFSTVPQFLLGFFVAMISAYFFTKDKAAIHQVYLTHVAPLLGLSVETTKKELKTSLWGYCKTQLILMLYTFGICIAGLLLLRSPHALLLSIVIALIDALPFFGSGFILWPGAVFHLLAGNTFLTIGYLAIYVIIQIMRQIMQPKVLGTQIGLHPLLTLFSMYFGLRCIGVWGLILGPIIAVLLKAFFRLRKEQAEITSGSKH